MPSYNNLPSESQYFKVKNFQQFFEDLRLAGMAKRTVYGYVRAIRKLCEYAKKPPTKLAEAEIRRFLLNEILRKESASGTAERY